jgi:hypothetical protein
MLDFTTNCGENALLRLGVLAEEKEFPAKAQRRKEEAKHFAR